MFFFKQNYEQIQEIQHILEKCNLNIKDLSETLDLNEKVKNPRIDTLLKIAKALDLTNDEFAELCGYRKDDKNGI